MKKAVLCLALLLSILCTALLPACGQKTLDRDKTLTALREMGYETIVYTTEAAELERLTDSLNNELKLRGEDFTVTLTALASLEHYEAGTQCALFEFESEAMAEQFFRYSIDERDAAASATDDQTADVPRERYARFGRVVIFTDSEEVEEMIGGEFQ